MPVLRRLTLRSAAAALAVVLAAGAAHAGGLDIHADADAADIGLPAYPGAVKKVDKGGDPSGFKFGIWGESFGIKIAVVSYRSVDSVDKVAAFYRDALAKYGPVLDCSHNAKRKAAPASSAGKGKSDRDMPVSCDDDSADAGGRLYKVGTRGAQRWVRLKPVSAGVSFQLLKIEYRGED